MDTIMKKLLLTLLFTPIMAFASSCPDFYANKTVPVTKTTLTEMCFTQFVVGYDPKIEESRYSIEVLTSDSVAKSKGNQRINSFHPDQKLAKGSRAELVDYLNTGYDKGHLTPFGDMVSKDAEYESFDLVNMVPQDKVNNEQLWKRMEMAVRDMASKEGVIYVVTGPVFSDKPVLLKNKLAIPQYMYKALYIPSKNIATVFLADNNNSWNYKYISINQLKDLTGMDVFPGLTDLQKNSAVSLFVIKK